MRNIPVSLGLLRGLSQVERDPLRVRHLVSLTDLWKFDMMHRRAGRESVPRQKEVSPHADAHKYCPLGRCGNRPGPFQNGAARENPRSRSAKITAWRKAKAMKNRRYLEEEVYGRSS